MARKAHSKDERTFGRHEVKVVRRLKTADYLVNVDYYNWAPSVMAVAILSLTDDLTVGLVTSSDDGLYPVDAANKLPNGDRPRIEINLSQKTIGCGVSDSNKGHYDYRRDLCAQERLLGDAGLVTLHFYCDVLYRRMEMKVASRIYDHLLDALVRPVDMWQISRHDDCLVGVINSYYPITQMNETFREQFVTAVRLVQGLLPRAISKARVDVALRQSELPDVCTAEGGVK